MEAVAHNPSFAKKVGVPQSVGKDFSTADKGKFSKGGDTMAKMNAGMMAMMAKKKPIKMAAGGMPMTMKDGKKVPAFAADGKGAMKHGGDVKKMNMGGMAYAKGGSASSRADGVASKGKTKGNMIKMNKGGMAC
jgi:hypothetical protein